MEMRFGLLMCGRKRVAGQGGSLHSALYDERRPVLTVAQRLSIALDVARGLAYLHERRIDDRRAVVHRLRLSPQCWQAVEEGMAVGASKWDSYVIYEVQRLQVTLVFSLPDSLTRPLLSSFLVSSPIVSLLPYRFLFFLF